MPLKDHIIKLATDQPQLRKHLVPLLRKNAVKYYKDKESLAKFLKEHKDADPKLHQVGDSKEEGKEQKGESGDDKDGETKGWKSKMKSLFNKVKNVPKDIEEAIRKAPEKVKNIVADPEARKKAMSTIAQGIRKSPATIASRIWNSAKGELKEMKHAAGLTKKLFQKHPEGLTPEDKKSLYATGAYVVGVALAAIPPGGLIVAAGALGQSFALHVGIKSVAKILDHGFLHFEWGESLLHATHFMASEDKGSEDKDGKKFIEAMTMVVADTIEELSEEDMEKILRGAKTPKD